MNRLYLELQKAQSIERDENGVPTYWRKEHTIKEFSDAMEFLNYVHDHAPELKNAVVFSGSAGLIQTANNYLTAELKKVGVL